MSLITELQRRNVIRVAVAYVVAGWVVTEVFQVAAEVFGAPAWVLATTCKPRIDSCETESRKLNHC